MMLSNNTLSVNSIAVKFKISRPAISKHLKILVNTKLVTRGRRGRERHYKINVEPLNEVRDWLNFYDKFWDKKLNQLKNYMEEL